MMNSSDEPYYQGTHSQLPPYPDQRGSNSAKQGGYPVQQEVYPKQQGQYPHYPSQQPGYPTDYQPEPPVPGFVIPPQQPYANEDTCGRNEPQCYESVMGTFDFDDKSVRRGFIRKVYAILMCQLAISLGFIAWFLYDDGTKNFIQDNPVIIIVAVVTVFVTVIAMSCCGDLRRKAPANFIFLGIFTVAESLLLGTCAAQFDSEAVLMAVGITTVVCLGLTLFAFQTKWDFTMLGGVLLTAVLVLMIFGIVSLCVHNRTTQMIYASLGAIVFSVYLIYDTQIMMGGNHKYAISPEEYIFAALNLYLDIVNLFLYILMLVGKQK